MAKKKTSKNREVAPGSPAEAKAAELADWERKHYEAIKSANTTVAEAAKIYERDKAKAKSSKQQLDDATESLSNLIEKGPDPQKKLPGMEDGPAKPKAAPEAWRKEPIERIGKLTPTVLKGLKAAKLTTIGAFADRTKKLGAGWFEGVEGVGAKAAEKIDEMFVAFWAANPEFCGDKPKAKKASAKKPKQTPVTVTLKCDVGKWKAGQAIGCLVDKKTGDVFIGAKSVDSPSAVYLDPEEYEVIEYRDAA